MTPTTPSILRLLSEVRWLLSACGLSLIVGCADLGPPTGTVSGRLTIGGAPPTEPVRVNFINSLIGDGAGAVTNADGTYKLDRPLRLGDYTVYLEKVVGSSGETVSTQQETLTIVLPEYLSEVTSPIKEIVQAGANVINLKLPPLEKPADE